MVGLAAAFLSSPGGRECDVELRKELVDQETVGAGEAKGEGEAIDFCLSYTADFGGLGT